MIHSTLSAYSLVVHFCPWHCFLSFASHVLYASAIIYRRDSSTPRSVPPAVCQHRSSCLSPRNSITFLLAGCSSAFMTAHPLCSSWVPSSQIEDFHLASMPAISMWRYELQMSESAVLGTCVSGLHNTEILSYSSIKFGSIHLNRKHYFFLSSLCDGKEKQPKITPAWIHQP